MFTCVPYAPISAPYAATMLNVLPLTSTTTSSWAKSGPSGKPSRTVGYCTVHGAMRRRFHTARRTVYGTGPCVTLDRRMQFIWETWTVVVVAGSGQVEPDVSTASSGVAVDWNDAASCTMSVGRCFLHGTSCPRAARTTLRRQMERHLHVQSAVIRHSRLHPAAIVDTTVVLM